jgi:hypothetical protein
MITRRGVERRKIVVYDGVGRADRPQRERGSPAQLGITTLQ